MIVKPPTPGRQRREIKRVLAENAGAKGSVTAHSGRIKNGCFSKEVPLRVDSPPSLCVHSTRNTNAERGREPCAPWPRARPPIP